MESSRVPSSINHLSLPLSRGQLKTRAEAKEQEAVIHERLRRANQPIPPYEFQNYIGKGSYGRVYVAKDLNPNGRGRVAVKVLDIDTVDFGVNLRDRDQSYKDFLKELKTLQQLQSYGAKNVNQIFDVLEVHSQFWIVSEYCPGGSVHTLMQATKNKVAEKYLIPIARELAVGLDAVHKARVIHRDVKAANVMIHEEGALQIIDFGVASMLHNEGDKRKTMIGTPHWMGPEALNPGDEGYGKEVDTWAYGCTLFEMATGNPPRSRLGPGQLEREFRLRGAAKLRVEQGYSQELCDLVASTLEMDPKKRPSMERILEHPYLKHTEKTYPTRSLKGFVSEFEDWAQAGGQRHSLFNNFGAAAAKLTDDIISKPEWRFSTLESTEIMEDLPATVDKQLASDFINNDHHLSSHFDQVADMTSTKAQEDAFNSYNASEPSSPYLSESDLTPGGSPKTHANTTPPTETTSVSATDDNKAVQGQKQLDRLFDPHKSTYKYSGLNEHQSDLPLRNSATESSTATDKGKEVEANVIGTSNSGNIALADAATLKAKRKDRPPTMAWEFPGEPNADVSDASEESQDINDRPFTKGWQFPEEGPGNDTDVPQAPLPSGVSENSSNTWDLDFEDNYGSPSDDAYEDPSYAAQYSPPPTANYSQATRDMTSDSRDSQNVRQTLDLDAFGVDPDMDADYDGANKARQTLDLDAFGAEPDLDADYDGANKARQTLDLDALMSDMELGSSNSASFEAPDDAVGTGSSRGNGTRTPEPASYSSDLEDEIPPPASNPPNSTNGNANSVPPMPPRPPHPTPPSAAAMAVDASDEVKEAELLRLFGELDGWLKHESWRMNRIVEEEKRKLEQCEREDKARGGQNGS